ncbi:MULTISPECIES: hypothetical protein [unclassified Cupriavidus]|nr:MULTISPECIES: hypothetical protein [unclassified Cupriavidus]
MLQGLSTLLLLQCIEEALATIAHVPIPGPLIGMLLLRVWLLV